MIDIKFRIWHNFVKEFIDPQGRYISLGGKVFEKTWNSFHEKGGCIVEQCTGLKDKNGKEIFEGDIVNELKQNKKGIIIFKTFRANFSIEFSKLTNNDLFRYIQYGNSIEIIGNIHENPELI